MAGGQHDDRVPQRPGPRLEMLAGGLGKESGGQPAGPEAAGVSEWAARLREVGVALSAVGVESLARLRRLSHWGCSRFQGFLPGRPQAARLATSWLVDPGRRDGERDG